MINLFTEHDDQLIQNFEIIFDRATSESIAKSNALEYYMSLVEDNKEIEIEEIVDVAESYGYDLSDFETMIKNYE
jgi:hypothetical protein